MDTEGVGTPHDGYFKYVMDRPADAAAELDCVLPRWFADPIDWSTLELVPTNSVSSQLVRRDGDRMYRAMRKDGRAAYMYAIMEHQSRPDWYMAARVRGYQSRFWDWYHKAYPDAEFYPAVIAVVVHTGNNDGRPWNAPTDFLELIDLPSDELEKYAPYAAGRFVLDDITTTSLTELYNRPLTPAARVMLIAEKLAARDPHFLDHIDRLHDDIIASGDLDTFIDYIAKVSQGTTDKLQAFTAGLGRKGNDSMTTIREQLRAEMADDVRAQVAREIRAGIAEEARASIAEQVAERLAEERIALAAARNAIEEERTAVEKERTAVKAAREREMILIQQGTNRFGPLPEWVFERLYQATPEQIRRWLIRLPDAGSLEEIFC